jgi:Spy/CpxP family protein refolding chaperone
MSILLDKQTEIAAQVEALAVAIEADIVTLKDQIISLTNENQQLQEALANIGTPEQLQAIIQPAIDHLTTIEQGQ